MPGYTQQTSYPSNRVVSCSFCSAVTRFLTEFRPSVDFTVITTAQKRRKTVQEGAINLRTTMNNCQQVMTVAVKTCSDPLATSLSRGAKGKPRINCLSVVIWMQHLAVIYVKHKGIMRKHFPSATACSNLHYMGGKPLKQIFDWPPQWNEYIYTH